MPQTHQPGFTSFPAPFDRYDRENEAQFRRQLERALLDLIPYIEERAVDEDTTPTHVLATSTALGTRHTISGAVAGAVLRASGATAANLQRLTASDIDPGTFPSGAYTFQNGVSMGALTATTGLFSGSVFTENGIYIKEGAIQRGGIFPTSVANRIRWINSLSVDILYLEGGLGLFSATAGGLTLGTVSLPWGDIFTNSIISINAVGYIRSTAGILQLQSGTTGIDIRDSTNAETRTRFTNAGELWHGVISGSGQTGAMFETKGRAVVRRDGVTTPGIWYENLLGYEQFVGQKSETHVGIWNTFWGIWVDKASLVETAADFKIGTLGRFDSADIPTDLQLLVYHESIGKWQAESIQFVRGSGDFKAALLGDNTAAAYVLLDPGAGADSPVGAPPDTGAITVEVGHKAFTLSIPAYTKPADFRYFEWQHCTGASCTGWTALVNSTSRHVVHSRLTTGDIKRYRVRAVDRAGNASAFVTTGDNTVVAQSDTQAFGGIIAGEIATVDLTALAGDIGILITGQIRNAANDGGINIGGVGGIPSGWKRLINFEDTALPAWTDGQSRAYINLFQGGAAGNTMIRHDHFELRYTGTPLAIFRGIAQETDSSPKFKIDFPNKLLTVVDEQASPQTRVKLGKIGGGTNAYGLDIRDANGALILSAPHAIDYVSGVFLGRVMLAAPNTSDFPTGGGSPPLDELGGVLRHNLLTFWGIGVNSTFSYGFIVDDGLSSSSTLRLRAGAQSAKRFKLDDVALRLSLGGDAELTIERHSANSMRMNMATGDALRFAVNGTSYWGITSAGELFYDATTSKLVANTNDASDNFVLHICGGGDTQPSRGSRITVSGNENANTGKIDIVAGNVTGGEIRMYTGDTDEAFRIDRQVADTTSMMLRTNAGGQNRFQRVEMGGVDSGGSGFRLLRVAN